MNVKKLEKEWVEAAGLLVYYAKTPVNTPERLEKARQAQSTCEYYASVLGDSRVDKLRAKGLFR